MQLTNLLHQFRPSLSQHTKLSVSQMIPFEWYGLRLYQQIVWSGETGADQQSKRGGAEDLTPTLSTLCREVISDWLWSSNMDWMPTSSWSSAWSKTTDAVFEHGVGVSFIWKLMSSKTALCCKLQPSKWKHPSERNTACFLPCFLLHLELSFDRCL